MSDGPAGLNKTACLILPHGPPGHYAVGEWNICPVHVCARDKHAIGESMDTHRNEPWVFGFGHSFSVHKCIREHLEESIYIGSSAPCDTPKDDSQTLHSECSCHSKKLNEVQLTPNGELFRVAAPEPRRTGRLKASRKSSLRLPTHAAVGYTGEISALLSTDYSRLSFACPRIYSLVNPTKKINHVRHAKAGCTLNTEPTSSRISGVTETPGLNAYIKVPVCHKKRQNMEFPVISSGARISYNIAFGPMLGGYVQGRR
ncbi:hypothetical protein B0H16DRAFT_1454032 [Mycena metata]|uniref:Uncharacterized protein n=1 Tax=Mycena metata TaxID=1033252 RepID=A0AAD7JMP3_9AGAR|nr:hypothetical protein B0H16DRAFT_1454032 [Mycena metata]